MKHTYWRAHDPHPQDRQAKPLPEDHPAIQRYTRGDHSVGQRAKAKRRQRRRARRRPA